MTFLAEVSWNGEGSNRIDTLLLKGRSFQSVEMEKGQNEFEIVAALQVEETKNEIEKM